MRCLPGTRRARLHGHGFVAKVRCELPAGWARFQGGEVDRLRDELQACVGVLDHRLLNEHLPQPSDAHLARWLRDRLNLPGRVELGVQSTAQCGADLDAAGRVQLWRRYAFHSAHRLPHVPARPQVRHDARARLRGDPACVDSGAGLSHDDLDAIWAPLHFQLNYGCLNDLPGLENPTSELLASWLWARIAPQLPAWLATSPSTRPAAAARCSTASATASGSR